MWKLLGVVSLLMGVGGFFFLSEATMGVGIISIGATLGIVARLLQAEAHQRENDEQLTNIYRELNKSKG